MNEVEMKNSVEKIGRTELNDKLSARTKAVKREYPRYLKRCVLLCVNWVLTRIG